MPPTAPSPSILPTADAVAEQLYALDPDRFVAARDAAVRELRAAGQRAEATAVKALRRPSVVGWALNQLVREDRVQVDALLSVGEELRHAQAALSGTQLRQLTAQRLKLVRSVASRAADLAAAAGRPLAAPTVEAVARSLDAALTDPATADVLLGARVLGELAYAGLGESPGAPRLAVVSDPAKASQGPSPSADHRRALRTAQQAVTEATTELDSARERAARARESAAAAHLRVASAEATLAAAQSELDAAGHDEEVAERAAELANRTEERAERRLDAARDQLADLTSR